MSTHAYAAPPRFRQPSASRFIATFGYAWFTIGLFTGTLVLVVAVRGILAVLQRFGMGQAAQNRTLIAVILLFVVASFALARKLVRYLYRKSPRVRRAALAGLALPALLSGWAWSNPTKFLAGIAGTTGSTVAMEGGPTFIFGSYPDYQRIEELKKQGVTAIVSLQSPAVLVEIQGINEERKSAQRAGIQFIEAPMLPWVSDNTQSLEKIKQLATHAKGTYYVHCGLGRDRVNIAKRVIESTVPQAKAHLAAARDLKHAEGFETRSSAFQRGLPMRLAKDAWVVPFLNQAEFYGFVLQGSPGHVYLVLDPADSVQKGWLADASKQLTQYAVPFTVVAYPGPGRDTATAPIVARLHAQAPPFTVIVPAMPFTPGVPKSGVARALARAWNSEVEALPSTRTASSAKSAR
jgi:hypothetical protein